MMKFFDILQKHWLGGIIGILIVYLMSNTSILFLYWQVIDSVGRLILNPTHIDFIVADYVAYIVTFFPAYIVGAYVAYKLKK